MEPETGGRARGDLRRHDGERGQGTHAERDRRVRSRFFSLRASIVDEFPEVFRSDHRGAHYRERGAYDFGDFSLIIREVSGWKPSRFDGVIDFPLRELFLAYVEILKKQARRSYETSLLVWAIQSPWIKGDKKPPDVPEILR